MLSWKAAETKEDDKVRRINRTIENPRIFVTLPSISPREAGGISKFRASEYRDNPCVFRVMCSKALPKVWFRATAARVVQQWPIVGAADRLWRSFSNLSNTCRFPKLIQKHSTTVCCHWLWDVWVFQHQWCQGQVRANRIYGVWSHDQVSNRPEEYPYLPSPISPGRSTSGEFADWCDRPLLLKK